MWPSEHYEYLCMYQKDKKRHFAKKLLRYASSDKLCNSHSCAKVHILILQYNCLLFVRQLNTQCFWKANNDRKYCKITATSDIEWGWKEGGGGWSLPSLTIFNHFVILTGVAALFVSLLKWNIMLCSGPDSRGGGGKGDNTLLPCLPCGYPFTFLDALHPYRGGSRRFSRGKGKFSISHHKWF